MGQELFDLHDYLIERCKFGDANAQEEIYKRYAKNMYNTAYRILNHQAEAEDVLQDAFLEAFTRIHDWRADSTFGAWMKKIVINRSISLLRKRKVEFIITDDVEKIADVETAFAFEGSSELIVSWIKKGINKLPQGYKLVLNLYLLEGYDHVEISEILNISESTSKSQFARAKEKLRILLFNSVEYSEYVK